MKEKRRDADYIADIERAARLAMDFARGLDRNQFETASMAQSAILYQLAIIGEAATHISKTFRASHPDIEWKEMTGMRNILVHAYHQLDLDVIWKATQIDLPRLLSQLENL